ncbi:hypothetical protein [Solimonas flava]|uniref:hypothetical protein n=1 Tax=Solimonas flava TaxID=415849 RepID=UPI00041AFCBF|nr:hypothetical protein [Solimonas flava]
MDALKILADQRQGEALRLQLWVRGCPSKRRYETEERARRGAARVLKFRKRRQLPYYCTHCAGWHLTSRPEPKP